MQVATLPAKAAKALRKSAAPAKLLLLKPSNRIPFDPAKAELARLLYLPAIALLVIIHSFMAPIQQKGTFSNQNSLLAD